MRYHISLKNSKTAFHLWQYDHLKLVFLGMQVAQISCYQFCARCGHPIYDVTLWKRARTWLVFCMRCCAHSCCTKSAPLCLALFVASKRLFFFVLNTACWSINAIKLLILVASTTLLAPIIHESFDKSDSTDYEQFALN